MSFSTIGTMSSSNYILNKSSPPPLYNFTISKTSFNTSSNTYSGFVETNNIFYVLHSGNSSWSSNNLFKTVNGGINFSTVNTSLIKHARGVVSNINVIYVGSGNNNTLIMSTDSGINWTTLLESTNISPSSMLISNNNFFSSTDGRSFIINAAHSNNVRAINNTIVTNVPSHSRCCCGTSNLSTIYVGSNLGKVHKVTITWGSTNSTTSLSCTGGVTINSSNLGYVMVACSSDGTIVYACTGTGRIYKSTNSGNSFSELANSLNVTDTNHWNTMACSSNGNVVVAARMGGFIHLSTDGGTTWSTGNSVSGFWWWVGVSSDGTKLFAGGGGSTGCFWTGTINL
jgi:photosystem II stability/assembly factor-like uncharacterized protein